MSSMSSRKYTVAVAGASGYAGGEFLRLAANHPNLEIGTLTAHSKAGQLLGAVHPHLRSLAERELVPTTPEALAGHDVVVLALPHGASGEIAKAVIAGSTRNPSVVEAPQGGHFDKLSTALETTTPIIIDLGADHRLIDPQAWQEYYGSEHPGTFTYGLPELINGKSERVLGFQPATKQRELLRNTKEIAVPGCNVIAVTLALQPGIAEGALDPKDIVAVLVNGYSGAGKEPKPHLIASEAIGSAKPYAVGGTHRHIPEILQNLEIVGAAHLDSVVEAPIGGLETTPATAPVKPRTAADYAISFTPTLAPMARGILAVVTAGLSEAWQIILEADTTENKAQTSQWLRDIWLDAYQDEPFVEVLPIGEWPATKDVQGANTALVQIALDKKANKVIIIVAIDNLVKGTAGSAIQSLNLALGLPETTGLPINGVAP